MLDTRSRFGISSYFFFYHAAVGLITPFAPLFLKELGYSYTAWGGLSLASAAGGAAVQMGIGYLSDHLRMRKPLIMIATIVLATIFQAFWHTTSYEAFVIIFALNGMMSWSTLTLVTALVGDLSDDDSRSFTFASMRVYGSIGWVLSLICTLIWPHMVEKPALFFAAISVLYMLAGVSVLLAREAPMHHAIKPSMKQAGRALFASRNMIIFLASYLIFMICLNSINNFLSLLIKNELGLASLVARKYVSGAFITSAAVEVPCVLLLSKLSDRIGRRPLLLMSFLVMPIRLILLSQVSSPIAVIGTQALHGFTWGVMMVVSVAFITESVPGNLRASGQGLLSMMAAASSGLWAVAAGQIGDHFSLIRMLQVVAMISLSALIIGFFLKEPTREEESRKAAVARS